MSSEEESLKKKLSELDDMVKSHVTYTQTLEELEAAVRAWFAYIGKGLPEGVMEFEELDLVRTMEKALTKLDRMRLCPQPSKTPLSN